MKVLNRIDDHDSRAIGEGKRYSWHGGNSQSPEIAIKRGHTQKDAAHHNNPINN